MVHYKQGINAVPNMEYSMERLVISIPNTPITVTGNQSPKGKNDFEDQNHGNTH
jgi:hypothetical protein